MDDDKRKEFIKAIRANRPADFIADEYWNMTKEELKEILLSVLYVGYDMCTPDITEETYMKRIEAILVEERDFVDMDRRIQDLTDDELIDLRSQIILNSCFLSDYENNLDIPRVDAANFFDGWFESEDFDDTDENLLKYFHSIEW